MERIVSYHPIIIEQAGEARIKDAVISYDAQKYEVSVENEQCAFRDNAVANYLNFKLKKGVSSFEIVIK